jgi:cysteine desulfurase/selenocysteine lyase
MVNSPENTGSPSLADRFRAAMPVAQKYVYLDHAAVAPLPEPTRVAIRHWLDQATQEGDIVWPEWAARVEETRARAARMIGAKPTEIALVPNTTTGISLVAEGFPWQPGDNVVTLANEFPSNQYPWLNLASRGVETRRVPVDGGVVDLNRLAEACDARTRIVSLSWVGYATGWRIDPSEVATLCRQKGARFFLDAIQGVGAFPLDVHAAGVDYLAADGHKWMLGPEGAGVFFVREELLSELRPLGCGWNSVISKDYSQIELNLRPTCARYEGGTQNMAGMIGLGASLDLLAGLGHTSAASPIAEHILQVTDHAAVRLEAIGARLLAPRTGEHRSGIITFQLPGRDANEIRRHLQSRGIVARCRAGGVRISPHGYNTLADIDRLVDEISAYAGERGA